MKFIRIHRRASAIVAIVLAATAVSASAASAQVFEGAHHRTVQPTLAVQPSPTTAQPSEPRAVDAQAALAHFYRVPTTALSNAQLNAHHKAAPTAAITAPKPAAPGDGFHWGDAAIGAAFAMAIVLLVAAAGTVVVRRRAEFGGA